MDDDSSSSQLSLPVSASAPHSSSSGSGGSAGETSPSVGNDPQEVLDNSSSAGMQSKSTSTGDEQPEDSSTSTKPKSPAGNETMASSSGANRGGKAKEIGILTDLYDLQNRTGRYEHLMAGGKGEPDFYKFWIQEEKEYANKQELDNKIEELQARYLKNTMDKNVEGPTDPNDVEILRLSELIWGGEIEWFDQETDEDDDQEQDSDDQDLADGDSSGRETAKKAKTDHHGSVDDQVDPEDSTKESGPIKKD